jgi:hypothetical protein
VTYEYLPYFPETAGLKVPQALVDKGIGHPISAIPTHYVGLDYIPFTNSNYQGNKGNDILCCPLAIAKLGKIYKSYSGNTGSEVECHYFFSDLLATNMHYPKRIRTNAYGGFKQEELAQAGMTFFAGDAIAYTDPYVGYQSDVAMAYNFSWGNCGERSTCFGAITNWPGRYTDDPPYYHAIGGPIGTFWDGHVETVTPPSLNRPTALQKHFTRDGTPIYVWPG